MRRFLTTFVLGLVAVASLTGVASAKEMSVALASGPPSLDPGEPWNAELLVHGEPAMLKAAVPGITFTNDETGETRTFAARSTGERAADGQLVYRARVVLHEEGRWQWGLVDGVTDRLYEGGLVQVGEPAATPTPAPSADPAAVSTGDDSLPAWPLAAGAAVLLLLLGGVAALFVRHRRLQPTA